MRPICTHCKRLERHCIYKPRKSLQTSVTAPSHETPPLTELSPVSGSRQSPERGTVSPAFVFEERNGALAETFRLDTRDPFLSPDSSIVDVTARLQNALRHQNDRSITTDDVEFEAASPSTLISRDIELTTTMDMLAARDSPLQPSFSFFVESVDCPFVTPYDAINWRQMKLDVADLGKSNGAVASAVIAISALYKGHLYSLPLSKALSLYLSSKIVCEKFLNDKTQDFGAILVATFILSLFEFIHYETAPFLKEPSEVFIRRLGSWAQRELPHSELCSRIIVWFRLLHATTTRGGGMGLISDNVYSLLPSYGSGVPSLRSPSNHHSNASTHFYEMLSAPIFEFYFQLQMISGKIAKLTHYHRSRTTGVDQEEIAQQMTCIKSQLHSLWESRSATQHQTAEDLRSHLAPTIASPIITLIGVCAAAYYAEFVEIDRVLGDPVSESTDSKQAMRRIREIVDGDWNTYNGGKLNSGYLRPLFLCAIECMDRDENQWAVARLEQIKNPFCRSDFFASFAKALSDAQLRKERRVTSKYFCIRYFGVSPPFM
jgi:hypothetical protein